MTLVHRTALAALMFGMCGCSKEIPQGVVIEQPIKEALPEEVASPPFPSETMNGPGIAMVMGGAHVKALKTGACDVLLPVPLLVDNQVPISYFIRTTPEGALLNYRLQQRDDSNVVVNVSLKVNKDEEAQIEWSSFVLIADKAVSPNGPNPTEYMSATSCVQSQDKRIAELADRLWPSSGEVNEYAKNIQDFIRNMDRKSHPKTLDALGILSSGANHICTANANLASALLRAKQIPSRSLAVIPPITHRLEMHRIVEYHDGSKWFKFDPSLLHGDIPLKPWQNVVLAKTTMADENEAMTPRMSAMVGCPYGQEFEFSKPTMTGCGNDFFWTIGRPIAEFEVSDKAIKVTADEWKRYLKSGAVGEKQIKASSARHLDQYLEAFQDEQR